MNFLLAFEEFLHESLDETMKISDNQKKLKKQRINEKLTYI